MKRILLSLLLIIAASPLAFGQSRNISGSKAEQDVLRTLDEVLRAMVEYDMPAIDRIYTDNYLFTGTSGSTVAKAQLIKAFNTMKSNGATYLSWTPSEMKIAIYGDAAVTNCRFEIKTRNGKGEIITANHRYTTTWVKQTGQWRLAAAHASEIKMAAPAQ